MGNIFKPDSPVMIALTRIADLMILNFLWLIGCLPVITIGTSTVALYYCVEQYREKGEIAIWKAFWGSYRSNFKQATVLMLVLCMITGIFVADVIILSVTEQGMGLVVTIIVSIIAFFCILAMGYVFPLQAKFSNTVKQTLKNAVILSMIHFPKSVAIAVVNMLPVALFLLWPVGFMNYLVICLVLGVALSAYINSTLLSGVFKRYYSLEKGEDDSHIETV